MINQISLCIQDYSQMKCFEVEKKTIIYILKKMGQSESLKQEQKNGFNTKYFCYQIIIF